MIRPRPLDIAWLAGAAALAFNAGVEAAPDDRQTGSTTSHPRDHRDHEESRGDPNADRKALRIGALAAVGFPRPVAIEAMMKFGGVVGLGAEYGVLPKTTLSGIDTTLWSLTADLRIFPFRGAFFLGVRGGYQWVAVAATLSAASLGSVTESASLETWIVNPRMGFLWTMKGGFTVGMEAGVQIPVSSSFSTTLPAPLALDVGTSGVVNALGGVLPTVDLLRLGFLF